MLCRVVYDLDDGVTDIYTKHYYTYSGPRKNQITSTCCEFPASLPRGLFPPNDDWTLAGVSPNGRWPPLSFPSPESFDEPAVGLYAGSLVSD